MDRLPLSALLSHALVAFTIELDNEFEHRMPHQTTRFGRSRGGGPWLVSLAMWANCMQFVGETGVRLGDLERLAGTPTNLDGMQRWGYITVTADSAKRQPRPRRADAIVHATSDGRLAQETWRPLFEAIEQRWRARDGEEAIDRLRAALAAMVAHVDVDGALPDCLPILGYGLVTSPRTRLAPRAAARDPRPTLSALLSKVLLAIALEFERASELSLAIAANVMRVLDERGVPMRDLPRLSGISKEAIASAIKVMTAQGFASIGAEASGRKAVSNARLTPRGRALQELYRPQLDAIEAGWRARFGAAPIDSLYTALAPIVGDRLSDGLRPYPDGWRAKVPAPHTLPHFPTVLHRGGFPDGS